MGSIRCPKLAYPGQGIETMAHAVLTPAAIKVLSLLIPVRGLKLIELIEMEHDAALRPKLAYPGQGIETLKLIGGLGGVAQS